MHLRSTATTRRTVVLTCSLFFAAFAGSALRPTIIENSVRPPLADILPKQVGSWQELPNPLVQVSLSTGATETTQDQPYDDQVTKTFADAEGHHIMVAVAYGAKQRQEVKIHRPELCYPAQGWKVRAQSPVVFDLQTPSGQAVLGHRMLAAQDQVAEAVSYWIRIGESYSDSPWTTRMVIIKEGLRGRMTDGVLVRFSQRISPGADPGEAYARQEQFAKQFVAAVRQDGRTLLLK